MGMRIFRIGPQKNVFILVSVLILAGCSPPLATEDVCISADQPLEFFKVLKNHINDVYDRCLESVREKLILELK
jgi:hypothetical protein